MPRCPDTPCITCGELLWSSASSAPATERKCWPCRRAAKGLDPSIPAPKRIPEPRRASIGCANPRCQKTILNPRWRQKWCSPQCRHRVQDAGPGAAARWARKNAVRRPSPHTAGAWAKLRKQVLAEESVCWVCEDDIDPAIRWPHSLCGTADHVVPIVIGGALLDRANVRAAHRACNQDRHVGWERDRRRDLRNGATA